MGQSKMMPAWRTARRRDGGAPTATDRIFGILFVIGLAIVLFVAGAAAVTLEIPPGPQIVRGIDGGRALYDKLTARSDIYASDLWAPARYGDQKGVTAYQPDTAQDGLTLYASGDAARAYLIDMNGVVRHRWDRPFSTVWRAAAGGVQDPQPDSHVYFRHVHAFPNGDLLALYEGAGDTPYGYGLVKLNRDSEVIWSYFGRAHHQFDVGPDGRIYVLTHEIVDEALDEFPKIEPTRIEDYLVVLSPDGAELQKTRLLDALAESPYRQMLHMVASYAAGDPLHTNSVKHIDASTAETFAFAEAGQILLSFRETNALAVLDPDTGRITWATQGPWIGQHDPDILPNGNILLFDNHGGFKGPTGISRVIEFDPRTMAIVWEYGGRDDRPLRSAIRSDQQRLANGNTLITESSGGRIVEVTPTGEIAWEFVNPVRGEAASEPHTPIIAWAQRLDRTRFSTALLNRTNDLSQRE